MPQDTIVPDRLAKQHHEKTAKWFDKVERELASFKNAPSIAPEQHHYAFENGTTYAKLAKSEGAFVPDQGFDGPA